MIRCAVLVSCYRVPRTVTRVMRDAHGTVFQSVRSQLDQSRIINRES